MNWSGISLNGIMLTQEFFLNTKLKKYNILWAILDLNFQPKFGHIKTNSTYFQAIIKKYFCSFSIKYFTKDWAILYILYFEGEKLVHKLFPTLPEHNVKWPPRGYQKSNYRGNPKIGHGIVQFFKNFFWIEVLVAHAHPPLPSRYQCGTPFWFGSIRLLKTAVSQKVLPALTAKVNQMTI